MENKTYQGWTNRETWLVKLWIDNEQETQSYWQTMASETLNNEPSEEARVTLARMLERTIEEDAPTIQNSLYSDLLTTALGRVDWFEISASLLDDIEESSATDEKECNLIYAYTRAQAIADGVLIDVSAFAAEAGFKYPVALTSAAWANCVAVPEGADD